MHTEETKDNAEKAFENYQLALAWEWPLDKALNYAARCCTCPAELDKLQILINKQLVNDMANEMHHFLETIAQIF